MARTIGAALALIAFFCASIGYAISPIMYADDQIARWPIIVIGYWPKAKIIGHAKEEGNSIVAWESHTRLVVTKVIHGNVGVGNHHLLLRPFIGWGPDGKYLNSASSTEYPGDVEDVSKPNLWILEWSQSWDKNKKGWFLSPRQFQFVQRLKFLPYFQTLRRKDRENAIASCLESKDEEIVERSLNYVNAWNQPWPFRPFRFDWDDSARMRYLREEKSKYCRLPQHLPLIGRIIDGPLKKSRPLAAALFAELSGKASAPRMRKLLADRDPNVAAVAAGFLVRFGDKASLPKIQISLKEVADPDIECEVAEAMRLSKDESYVPAIISLLERDTGQGFSASEKGVEASLPALYAKNALLALTGFVFPYDVEESLRIWDLACRETNLVDRHALLLELLGEGQDPIYISFDFVVGSDGKRTTKKEEWGGESTLAEFTVTNRSRRSVVMFSMPSGITVFYDQGVSGGYVQGKQAPITLPPDGKIRFKAGLPEIVFDAPDSATIWIEYLENEHRLGKKVWIGAVKAVYQNATTPPSR